MVFNQLSIEPMYSFAQIMVKEGRGDNVVGVDEGVGVGVGVVGGVVQPSISSNSVR